VYEFRLADVGEGIHEVQVLAWNVHPGEQVAAFQALCQVESAKATVELTSPVAGRVVETRVPEGGLAQVGQVLAVIDQQPSEYFGIVGSAPAPEPASHAGPEPPVRASAHVPAEVATPPAGEGPARRADDMRASASAHVPAEVASPPAGEGPAS
jgi:pyruvate/2-oxoglutarate dehydrogenase complex dihydrolipoamide acyltransferase (E2) component